MSERITYEEMESGRTWQTNVYDVPNSERGHSRYAIVRRAGDRYSITGFDMFAFKHRTDSHDLGFSISFKHACTIGAGWVLHSKPTQP